MRWIFRWILVVMILGISFLAFTPGEMPDLATISDKLNHCLAFLALALVLDCAFPDTQFNGTKVLTLLFYGLFIEGIQYLLPYREFSLLDWLADGVGISLYWLYCQTPFYPFQQHK